MNGTKSSLSMDAPRPRKEIKQTRISGFYRSAMAKVERNGTVKAAAAARPKHDVAMGSILMESRITVV